MNPPPRHMLGMRCWAVDYWALFWDTGAPEAWLMARDTEDGAWTTEHS